MVRNAGRAIEIINAEGESGKRWFRATPSDLLNQLRASLPESGAIRIYIVHQR